MFKNVARCFPAGGAYQQRFKRLAYWTNYGRGASISAASRYDSPVPTRLKSMGRHQLRRARMLCYPDVGRCTFLGCLTTRR